MDDAIDPVRIGSSVDIRRPFDGSVDAADAISADAEPLGAAAVAIIEAHPDAFVDNVLLIDRMHLDPKWRGNQLSGAIITDLLALLRLDADSTVVVLRPESQKPAGGPYDNGQRLRTRPSPRATHGGLPSRRSGMVPVPVSPTTRLGWVPWRTARSSATNSAWALWFLSAYRSAPSPTGGTLVLLDRSGSMFRPLARRSAVTRADAGAVFGAALAVRAASAYLVQSGMSSEPVKVRRGGSVLSLARTGPRPGYRRCR